MMIYDNDTVMMKKAQNRPNKVVTMTYSLQPTKQCNHSDSQDMAIYNMMKGLLWTATDSYKKT